MPKYGDVLHRFEILNPETEETFVYESTFWKFDSEWYIPSDGTYYYLSINSNELYGYYNYFYGDYTDNNLSGATYTELDSEGVSTVSDLYVSDLESKLGSY